MSVVVRLVLHTATVGWYAIYGQVQRTDLNHVFVVLESN